MVIDLTTRTTLFAGTAEGAFKSYRPNGSLAVKVVGASSGRQQELRARALPGGEQRLIVPRMAQPEQVGGVPSMGHRIYLGCPGEDHLKRRSKIPVLSSPNSWGGNQRRGSELVATGYFCFQAFFLTLRRS
jgi:hypothetical protein